VPVSRRGQLTVNLVTGSTSAQAVTGRQLREQFAYRVHDGEVQVIDPPRKTVVIPELGRIVQHDVGTLTRLNVDVDG
jgi:hypothetical protein